MGQYSPHALPVAEEMPIGAFRFGRGYDPSAIAGDRGLGGTLEFRYTLPVTEAYIKWSEFYLFLDGGIVWNDDPLAGEDDSLSLSSAGPGLRVNFPHNIFGVLEAAFPLKTNFRFGSEEADRVRLLLTISARF